MNILILAQVYNPALYGVLPICADANNKRPISGDSQVLGTGWLVPTFYGATDKFEYVEQGLNGGVAPTADSLQFVKVFNEALGRTQYVLGTQADWVSRANACCGSTPEMPNVVIPAIINESIPCVPIVCAPSSAGSTFEDSAPVLAAGQAILPVGSNAGVAFTPAAPPAGFASLASALTWIQANWGAYGTWTMIEKPNGDDVGIKLNGTTVKQGSFSLSIRPAGAINALGTVVPGSGGEDGVYTNVPLTGGAGSGATANITVASGAVTGVALQKRGKGYVVSNSLSALPGQIGGTTGFSVPVASLLVGS